MANITLPKMPSLKAAKTVRCACGCGDLCSNRFRPGHDAKLLAMRKRVERGLWAETPEGKAIDPIAQLDALAAWGGDGRAAATAADMGVKWTPKAERKTA